MDEHYELECTRDNGKEMVFTGSLFTDKDPAYPYPAPTKFDTAAEAFEALGRWRVRMTSRYLGAWDCQVVRVVDPPRREVVDP